MRPWRFGLHSEYQASQGYNVILSLKNPNQIHTYKQQGGYCNTYIFGDVPFWHWFRMGKNGMVGY